ncbi:hypothetical protein GE21DRAFT_1192752, partial [Neurospora crassa]
MLFPTPDLNAKTASPMVPHAFCERHRICLQNQISPPLPPVLPVPKELSPRSLNKN